MKRKISLLLTALLLVSCITGCGNAGTSNSGKEVTPTSTVASDSATTPTAAADTAGNASDASDEQITLRMSWWGNQTRNDLTIQVLDLYTQLHPNVTFETEPSDWSGYFDKLATQAATGSMPDIIQQDYGQLSTYYDKNLMLNLQPYIESGVIDTSRISGAVLASGSFNEDLYAMCIGLNTPVLLYDKETIQAAGVTIPEQMTYQEFFAISKTIFEKTGVQTYFDSGLIGMMYRGEGLTMYSADGTSFGSEDDSIFLDYFTMVKQAMDEGWHVSPEVLVEKDPNIVETMPLIDQTTWNSFTNSNQYTTISNTAGRDLGMSMFPCKEDDVQQVQYLKSSQFLTASATTEYPEVVADFINFFVTSVDANKILNGERGVPVDSAVLASFSDRLTPQEQEVFDFIDKINEVATPMDPPTPSGSSEIGTLLNDLTEQVRYGLITPEDAAEQVFTEGNDILMGENGQ